MFAGIQLHGWRQFDDIDIDFDSPVTVITGANGSGKTTILHILSRHFGWDIPWIATRQETRSKRKFWSAVESQWEYESTPKKDSIPIGRIRYENGAVCGLLVPRNVEEQYAVSYDGQQNVPGIHIPSHSQPFNYQNIDSLPTDPKGSAQQFQDYQKLMASLYISAIQPNRRENAWKVIKRSIIGFAVFGFGNQAVAPNEEYYWIFQKLQDVLRVLLPKELGFQKIEVRMPDALLITDTGDFSLDSVSGGVASLIAIGWQILMFSLDRDEFVVTIDEPENHLHPAMQRDLLGNLEKAFPLARFIISTHSPFVITSNRNARVYCLTYLNRKVISQRIEGRDLSGDYNETLREVLGVPITVPPWVETAITTLYINATRNGITKESMTSFRDELKKIGLLPQLPFVADSLGE